MIVQGRGRHPWKILIAAGVAATIAGCTSTGSRPAFSKRAKTPSEVVPEAVARFSASRELRTNASANPIGRSSTADAALPHDLPTTDMPAGESISGASGVTSYSRIIPDRGTTDSKFLGTAPPSPKAQPIQLAANVDSSIQTPQSIPLEADSADRILNALPTKIAVATELPLPAPMLASDGAIDSENNDVTLQHQVAIDLASALQFTAGQNPQVGYAQQRIQEAYAQLQSAEVLWVPSLRAGVNYNKHDGTIQNVEGDIITNSRSSIYTGFGAQAVGAGSPAVPGLLMNFHLRDAIFQPRIAEQVLGARQNASRTATNDMLLETALRYMDLLEAIQVQAVAKDSLRNAEQLSQLTKSFADAGQGLQADADRALTELSVRQIEVRRAAENARVASVRLARVLSQQDQSQMLVPQEPALIPIEMVVPSSELSELVATGLTNRPELAESHYLVGEAVQRLNRERYAPLVPSMLLGLSYGGNGGSPNSTITGFSDRVDFDVGVYWEVRNLGFGEQYARQNSRSQLEQTRWRQVQVMDQVASEIAESHAQVEARQSQIKLAEGGITAAQDSYRRNSERIRDAQGLPIETLQSIQALDQARRQYVRAVADYNRAQFQLQRALGWPIQ